MLTPSLVFAYRMRGSAIGTSSHREQPLWLSDALQLVLAPVLEADTRRRAGKTPHRVRHEHLARGGCARYSGGDVNRAAVDVVALADHVTGVDAEVELKADRFAGGVAAQSALDGLPGGGEDSQNAVAEELTFDGGAAGFADHASEHRVQLAGLLPEGRVAQPLGEGGGVRDIGEQNDGGAGGEFGRARGRLLPLAQEVVDGARDLTHDVLIRQGQSFRDRQAGGRYSRGEISGNAHVPPRQTTRLNH